MMIHHEYDDAGNHRLTLFSTVGLWFGYRDFAQIVLPQVGTVFCATDFWEPTFKADEPFIVGYFNEERR